MDITVRQVVYALVFLAVLLLVEGVYMTARGANRRELAVNRRMKAVSRRTGAVLNPSIMRREALGGDASRRLLEAVPSLEPIFWAAGLGIAPALAVGLSIGATMLLFLVLANATFLPLFMALFFSVLFGMGLPFFVLKLAADKKRKEFSSQLPDAINLVTRGLQAGHPVAVAFELVGREMPDPIGGQFGMVIDEISFGRERDAALKDVAKRFPDPDFKFFIAAVEMQRETGGNLVSILENLTKLIRERTNMRKKAWAISAEGRLTCLMVGAMPYFVGAMLTLLNPEYMLGSADHPLFWPAMFAAWVMWALGIAWIWRMVNIKV